MNAEHARAVGGPSALVARMDERDRLRFAMLALAQPPSSQRRWVQLGNMRAACEILDAEGDSAGRLQRDGVLTGEQADGVREVVAGYVELREAREDLLEERRSAPRAFLWSDAMEDAGWLRLRHLARDCYVTLSEGRPPIIDE